ncbi:MAG: hypothetical protein GY950_08985 [bacterium]|nr:hypothetical protein [bacterium]
MQKQQRIPGPRLGHHTTAQRETVCYKNITPIWEDDLSQFNHTRFLMVHARSAFRDQGITIENNMPFSDDTHSFIFNGELQSVRINAPGRIGAEKLFNVIKRFNKGNTTEAFKKGISFIQKRTAYIRAMNILMSDMHTIYLCSLFNREPRYFTMHMKREDGCVIICSEKYPGETGWTGIKNNTIEVFT